MNVSLLLRSRPPFFTRSERPRPATRSGYESNYQSIYPSRGGNAATKTHIVETFRHSRNGTTNSVNHESEVFRLGGGSRHITVVVSLLACLGFKVRTPFIALEDVPGWDDTPMELTTQKHDGIIERYFGSELSSARTIMKPR